MDIMSGDAFKKSTQRYKHFIAHNTDFMTKCVFSFRLYLVGKFKEPKSVLCLVPNANLYHVY